MRRRCVVGLLALGVALATAVMAPLVVNAASPPLTASVLRSRLPSGVLPALPDQGPASDRTALRAAALGALDDEFSVFVIDTRYRAVPRADALAALTTPAVREARIRLLGRSRTPALARKVSQAVDYYLQQDFGPSWRGPVGWDVFGSGAFHVERYQGVQVAGDTGRVLLRGENRGTSWEGEPKRDAWVQYRMLFKRSATAVHGWRLVRIESASTAA